MKEDLFRFGPFELDAAGETLRRSGLVARLPRQPFRILLLLVRRAGEVVTRDEIHSAIWGDETYVDFEHGINSAIRQIRFVLGDHAETPRYVRTLPRRGYSFIARVELVAHGTEDVPASVAVGTLSRPPALSGVTRRVIAIAVATTIITITSMAALIVESRRNDRPRAIAVLPFRHLGPPIAGFDERPFAEELRANVGALSPAHVSLTRREDADVWIEGTIREAGDGVRVIVSAVDAPSHTQFWSETYERPAGRKEGMAVEVAHRVTQEMARRYLPPPRRAPLLKTNARRSALELYEQARSLHSRGQTYDWTRARDLYEAALREEPRFAEAWSGLADVWAGRALRGAFPQRERAAVRAADCARRALALQPRNAEAHATLGMLAAQHEFDLVAAEDALRAATNNDPGYVDAHTNLAMVLAMRGLCDESLRQWAVALQLDPVGLDLSPIEPFLYLQARRYEDARTRYREILAVRPDSQTALWGLLFTLITQKNWSEALVIVRTFRPEMKLDAEVPVSEAGFLELYRQFDVVVQTGRAEGVFNDYFVAVHYAQTGRRDRALELLGRAIDARLPVASYVMVDPRLDPLRGDPRFRVLTRRLKLGQQTP